MRSRTTGQSHRHVEPGHPRGVHIPVDAVKVEMTLPVAHIVELACVLQSRGVDLRVLLRSIDTSTPGGLFTFRILASIAEFERDLISERTRNGRAAARARSSRPARSTDPPRGTPVRMSASSPEQPGGASGRTRPAARPTDRAGGGADVRLRARRPQPGRTDRSARRALQVVATY